jgi:UDP-GlcNAc:undecaprenyl-phosphate GlcNAc-1-phosphate transferase
MLTVMTTHGYLVGVIAFLICAGFLPIIRYTALRLNVHDLPGHLKIHSVPIPRLGGIAIGVATVTSLMFSPFRASSHVAGICLALMVIWYVGLLDDLMNLSPAFRLVAQLFAGVLVSQTPWGLKLTGIPVFDIVLTCLFVAVFVNAFNFLDGADGLAGGVAGFIALGYAALYSSPVLAIGGLVAWILLGACLGFLAFNFPPAKIFMGDSGSTTLGFVVAFLALDFYRVHYHIGTRWLLPLVFAALPLLDFFLAVLRRIRRRVSPLSGDRRHFYDLLLERGWSSMQVAFGAYAVTGALLLVGWLCMDADWKISLAVSILTVVTLLLLAARLGAFRWSPDFILMPRRQQSPDRSSRE